MADQVVFKVSVERVTPSYEDLLQDCDNVGVVECLSSQGVNDCRDVDITSRKQRCKLMLDVHLLPGVLEQEVDVARETHFS